MAKTFIELYAMKVDDLRKQCKIEKKATTGTKKELIKRLFPEANNYVFMDKTLSELKQICRNRGWGGYSKQKWAELIIRLQPKSQMKTPDTILPIELVMIIRKQATDISKYEFQRKQCEKRLNKILFYIKVTKCNYFYKLNKECRELLLTPNQKTIIHQFIEKYFYNTYGFY